MNSAALIEAGFTAAQAAIILKREERAADVADLLSGGYIKDDGGEWADFLDLTDAEIEEWLR